MNTRTLHEIPADKHDKDDKDEKDEKDDKVEFILVSWVAALVTFFAI